MTGGFPIYLSLISFNNKENLSPFSPVNITGIVSIGYNIKTANHLKKGFPFLIITILLLNLLAISMVVLHQLL